MGTRSSIGQSIGLRNRGLQVRVLPGALIDEGLPTAAPLQVPFRTSVDSITSKGAGPLLLAEGNQIAGVVVLEDALKPSMKDRFARLRNRGLRTVMITGDNPLTAAAIARQAGVNDFLAQATPGTKLAYLKTRTPRDKSWR